MKTPTDVYAPWEELRVMFIEMNKYNAPCPYKRALEHNAVQALQDSESEFDPFSGSAESGPAENIGLSSREYFLSTIDLWCHPSNVTEKENPALIDEYFKAIRVNTQLLKASNPVSINRFVSDLLYRAADDTSLSYLNMFHIYIYLYL